MANSYIDDSGLIYSNNYTLYGAATRGDTKYLTLGLNDISTTLSTMIIDNVRYHMFITMKSTGPALATYLYGATMLSVTPYQYTSASAADSLNDLQEVKGWPIKDSYKMFLVTDHQGREQTAVSGTYKPRNKLALNRLQEFVLSVDLISNDAVTAQYDILMVLNIQAKRGGIN